MSIAWVLLIVRAKPVFIRQSVERVELMGTTAGTVRDAVRIEEARWEDFRRALRPIDIGLLDWNFDAARSPGEAAAVVLNPRDDQTV